VALALRQAAQDAGNQGSAAYGASGTGRQLRR
jgi:hypothetical protein